VHTKLQLQNLKGEDSLGDVDADGMITLKFILRKLSAFNWLRMGLSDWLS
jgi:hypothetical protein